MGSLLVYSFLGKKKSFACAFIPVYYVDCTQRASEFGRMHDGHAKGNHCICLKDRG